MQSCWKSNPGSPADFHLRQDGVRYSARFKLWAAVGVCSYVVGGVLCLDGAEERGGVLLP